MSTPGATACVAAVISTLAGSSNAALWIDGTGSTASFNFPRGVALDLAGNVVVADGDNHRIRRVTPSGGAQLDWGVMRGRHDSLICSLWLHWHFAVVSNLAGGGAGTNDAWIDGSGTMAAFSRPVGVAVDASGNVVVADTSNHRIRLIAPNGGSWPVDRLDGQSVFLALSACPLFFRF